MVLRFPGAEVVDVIDASLRCGLVGYSRAEKQMLRITLSFCSAGS